MSKTSRQLRRERKLAEKLAAQTPAPQSHEAPALRLVRSEEPIVPVVDVPAGRADPAVIIVPEQTRFNGASRQEENQAAVVAAVNAGPRGFPGLELRRTFDPAEANAILNHPSVLPNITVPGLDVIDIAPVLADERNVCLMADNGCLLFCWHEPGAYEVHTNFIKPERGAHGNAGPYIRNACVEAYRWMFSRTDCLILLTRIPEFNRAATIFAPLLGWNKQFERKAAWPTKDGLCGMTYWTLPYADWVRKTPELIAIGKQFHDHLKAEFARRNYQEIQHADEDCHDQNVGACVEMLRGGQYEKAVSLYNGWARFAGYGQIALVSVSPTILDIGNAILQIADGTFKVIRTK